MSTSYKLPKCWLGKTRQVIGEDGQTRDEVITEDDVEIACHCINPAVAFFCPEGHMTECHVGQDCDDAQCSHLSRYDPYGESVTEFEDTETDFGSWLKDDEEEES